MWQRRSILTGGLAFTLTGGATPKIRIYKGREITRVVVQKIQRKMYLLSGSKVLRTYNVDLGFDPTGHKAVEGDGRTPEGPYYINRRNPNSRFHLSLGISYPNAADITRAKAMGLPPGGDIFIHGARRWFDKRGSDWTSGCISVSNKEIEEIYAMVSDGTQIDINP